MKSRAGFVKSRGLFPGGLSHLALERFVWRDPSLSTQGFDTVRRMVIPGDPPDPPVASTHLDIRLFNFLGFIGMRLDEKIRRALRSWESLPQNLI